MNRHKPREPRWLLLLNNIPRKSGSLRLKVWRHLQRIGAVPVKYGVYALPRSEDRNEDLQWVLREIVAGGGEATLCEASFIQGMSDDQVEASFVKARDADYAVLATEIRRLQKSLPRRERLSPERRQTVEVGLRRLRDRLDEISAIDFFSTSGRESAAALLATLEGRMKEPITDKGQVPRRKPAKYEGRVWVTRKGIFVDRIASAWLIKRFVDPKARFKFVQGKGYVPEPDELRFDMFEAEFTHVGDRCTFEVLLAQVGLDDPALGAIAEVVHDIDVKDRKFGRPEAAGIEMLLAGIALRSQDDEERLQRGSAVFEDLYAVYRRKR